MIKQNPLATDLVGEKTTKLDSRVAFFGAVDELSCHIMEVWNLIDDKEIKDDLISIAEELIIVCGEVAGGKTKLQEESVCGIVSLIEKYRVDEGVVSEFIVPGKTLISSKIHITRCVARRAELSFAKVYAEHKGSEIVFEYLNKLSTFFYELAKKFDK